MPARPPPLRSSGRSRIRLRPVNVSRRKPVMISSVGKGQVLIRPGYRPHPRVMQPHVITQRQALARQLRIPDLAGTARRSLRPATLTRLIMLSALSIAQGRLIPVRLLQSQARRLVVEDAHKVQVRHLVAPPPRRQDGMEGVMLPRRRGDGIRHRRHPRSCSLRSRPRTASELPNAPARSVAMISASSHRLPYVPSPAVQLWPVHPIW